MDIPLCGVRETDELQEDHPMLLSGNDEQYRDAVVLGFASLGWTLCRTDMKLSAVIVFDYLSSVSEIEIDA